MQQQQIATKRHQLRHSSCFQQYRATTAQIQSSEVLIENVEKTKINKKRLRITLTNRLLIQMIKSKFLYFGETTSTQHQITLIGNRGSIFPQIEVINYMYLFVKF